LIIDINGNFFLHQNKNSKKHEIVDISIEYVCIVQLMVETFPEFPLIFYPCHSNSKEINFHFQDLEDHTDISQAAVMYIFEAGSVCLYCWFGSELSEQVRKIML